MVVIITLELVDMKENLHFLHIPKTGGTSLKNALRKISDTGTYNIILHKHNVTLLDIPIGEKFFFCLRNPIERYISNFYGRFRCGRPSHISPHSPMEVKIFSVYKTPNQLAEDLTCADEDKKLFAMKSILNIRHLRPQYSKFLISEMFLEQRKDDILDICKTENLNIDFENLKIKLGLSFDVFLPRGDFNSNKRPKHYVDTAISELGIENLKRFYRPDYDILEYCKSNYPNLK
jgi:hypothetical protein